jgi:cell wall-associated NlpC family hydrolase
MSIPEEATRRADVIREAVSWIGTPFRFSQQEKGLGCDCGNFVMGVFGNCGWPKQRFTFPRQFFKNRNEEIYRAELEKRCALVESPAPGDIALFHVGRVYWHGAIVVEWPTRIIHCTEAHGVCYGDASKGMISKSRSFPPIFFDPYRA